jgi:HPt (histidine-containing phosphotransfer) domain-containing protein
MLAGSAGMFGFARLAFVARHFQNAIQSAAGPDTPALAIALDAVLRETLGQVRNQSGNSTNRQ